MADDNCTVPSFLSRHKDLLINGWMFCESHGLEWCHRCRVDHRPTNNVQVEDELTEEQMELLTDFALEDFADRVQITSVTGRWKLVPGSNSVVCLAHSRLGCSNSSLTSCNHQHQQQQWQQRHQQQQQQQQRQQHSLHRYKQLPQGTQQQQQQQQHRQQVKVLKTRAGTATHASQTMSVSGSAKVATGPGIAVTADRNLTGRHTDLSAGSGPQKQQ